MLQEKEWQAVSKGLQQRAELLNLVLKDIYGERRLIKDGIIPHEVIYAHRGFLGNVMVFELLDKMLSLYAADISRGTDGRAWW